MKLLLIFFFLIFISCGELEIPEMPTDRFAESQSASFNNVIFRFIDVESGDATLIQTASGKNILIDSGTSDAAKMKVLPSIRAAGNQLEYIIATHYDNDHIGGISGIIKGADERLGTDDDIIPNRGIIDRGDVGRIDKSGLADYFISTEGIRRKAQVGETLKVDDIIIRVLGMNGLFLDGTKFDISDGSENAHSLSLLITHGNIKILISGDLPGPNFENKYEPLDIETTAGKIAGDIDILHVSHHGSHNSTSTVFLDYVSPQTAIISVGENRYSHPSDIVLENLKNIGCEIYLTNGDWIDKDEGLNIIDYDICLESDGDDYRVDKCL